MVDQPWTPELPEALPPSVLIQIRRYQRNFKWLRTMVSLQLLLGGGFCGSGCVCMGFFIPRSNALIPIAFGLALLGFTGVCMALIRSAARSFQITAYNFAQATNAITMLVLCGGGAQVIDKVLPGLRVLLLLTLIGVFAIQLHALVWMLWFHELSRKIRRYKSDYNLKPKETWEVSPWANFEAPVDTEELEVDGSWDNAGPPAS